MNLLGGNSFLQNSNRYCDQCSAYQGQSPICLACLSLLHFCSLQSWDGLINGHDVCLPRHLNVHSVDGVRHSGSTFSLPSQDLHVANACKTPRALPPPPSDPQDGPWSRGHCLKRPHLSQYAAKENGQKLPHRMFWEPNFARRSGKLIAQNNLSMDLAGTVHEGRLCLLVSPLDTPRD